MEEKKSKKGKIILNAIFFSVMAFLVTIFVWNFIDIQSGYKYPVFGSRTSVIVTESMATVNKSNDYITSEMKQIQKNDVITTVSYKSYDEIKIYDIATYYDGSRTLVCHRVVDKYVTEDGRQYVIFRGDANNVNDAPVLYDLVRGKVTNITPKVGTVVAFVQSPYLFIALFGTVFFIALAIFIVDFRKEKNKGEEKVEDKEAKEEPQAEEVQAEEKPQEEVQEEPQEEKPYEPAPLIELEPVKEENAGEDNNELPPLETVEEPKKEEAPAVEEAPKEEPVKEKPAPKKKAEPKVQEKEKEPEPKDDSKKDNTRVYHVNKRKEDNKWTVKFAGGEKVIKLFDTQKEALEYANQMAKNQDGTVLVHASKGANKGRIIKK